MRLLLPVFAIAVAVRAIPLGRVLTPFGLLPGGLADEYYHLRRIWYSVVNFPASLDFDPYVSFPDGGHVHWPAGFDWLLAAVARLLAGDQDQAAVERVVAWVPPVLGGLTAVAAAWIGRSAFGRAGGWTAGLLLAVLPVNYHFSRVGMVDHHVAVALSGALLLGAGMAWLRRDPEALGATHPLGVALGATLALPFLVWPGFLLQAALTAAVLAAALLASGTRAAAVARARSLAVAHGLALAILLPFCLGPPFEQYGPWSPLVLSRFQPAWFGAAAGVLGASAGLWSAAADARLPFLPARWAEDRRLRVASAAAVGLLGAGAFWLLSPGLREAMLYASGWFAEAEDFQGHVAELLPLSLPAAATRYSLLFFAFPLALAGVARRALRERSGALGLLLAWAGGFLLLALQQRRFNNSFALPYALVWGGALAALLPALRARLAGRPLRALGAGAAALALGLVAFEPVLRDYAPQLERSWQARSRPQLAVASLKPAKRVQLAAARWLERATPPTRGYLDASLRPGYGVLVRWDAGHLYRYRARRPMVQDNFGVYGGRETFALAWEYYAARDEAAAVALLERLGVRYVVADRAGAGSVRPYPPDSMAHRLAGLFGSAARVQDPGSGRALDVPALAHHRLVFHARSSRGDDLVAEPPQVALGVWEPVPGARVAGRAPPGDRIQVALPLATAAGARHVYRTRTRADASGRYELVVPYANTGPAGRAVVPGRAYRLEGAAGRGELVVSESDVREGRSVRGPSLLP